MSWGESRRRMGVAMPGVNMQGVNMQGFNSPIDWQAPWLKGYRAHGQAVMALWHTLGSLSHALNTYASQSACRLDAKDGTESLDGKGEASALASSAVKGAVKSLPLFVSQASLPPGQAYESFIYTTHQVPTRDNLHDFFNALCWMRFPRTKSFLNAQQASAIEQLGHVRARGALRDALTLLDENACFVDCEERVWRALVAHDWVDAFWTQRTLWTHARVELFGHALLEKLCTPYKAITAHALRIEPPSLQSEQSFDASGPEGVGAVSDEQLDAQMLATLTHLPLQHKPFQALPVLGVPGWHADSQEKIYYEDVRVFRPKRVPMRHAPEGGLSA